MTCRHSKFPCKFITFLSSYIFCLLSSVYQYFPEIVKVDLCMQDKTDKYVHILDFRADQIQLISYSTLWKHINGTAASTIQIQKDFGRNTLVQDEGRISSTSDQNQDFIHFTVSILVIRS